MRKADYLIRFLPKDLAGKWVRKQMHLQIEHDPEIEIKIAETPEELSEAYRVLHDCYVEKKYMNPHETGMRITPYHILPTTTTIIIKEKSEVVGTMSLVVDGAFGLPCDKLFDLKNLRQQKLRIAEIGSLGVKFKSRNRRGQHFFRLIKYVFYYLLNKLNVDVVVFAVNPAQKVFYDHIICMDDLKEPVKSYDFVNGADTLGYYNLIPQLFEKWKSTYGKNSLEKNLYDYIISHQDPSFKYPDRPYFKFQDPQLTPQTMGQLFESRQNLFLSIPIEQRRQLISDFSGTPFHQSYKEFILPENRQTLTSERHEYRFESSLNGFIKPITANETQLPEVVLVRNLSQDGLCLSLNNQKESLALSSHFLKLKVPVNAHEISELTIEKVRYLPELHEVRCRIVESDEVWTRYIQYLNKDLFKIESAENKNLNQGPSPSKYKSA